MSSRVVEIGQQCLQEWVELIKVFGSWWDWSSVSAGVGWIGQLFLREWMGSVENMWQRGELVKCLWSGRDCQECL